MAITTDWYWRRSQVSASDSSNALGTFLALGANLKEPGPFYNDGGGGDEQSGMLLRPGSSVEPIDIIPQGRDFLGQLDGQFAFVFKRPSLAQSDQNIKVSFCFYVQAATEVDTTPVYPKGYVLDGCFLFTVNGTWPNLLISVDAMSTFRGGNPWLATAPPANIASAIHTFPSNYGIAQVEWLTNANAGADLSDDPNNPDYPTLSFTLKASDTLSFDDLQIVACTEVDYSELVPGEGLFSTVTLNRGKASWGDTTGNGLIQPQPYELIRAVQPTGLIGWRWDLVGTTVLAVTLSEETWDLPDNPPPSEIVTETWES